MAVTALSADFPVTLGAFQTSMSFPNSAFVSKFSADGASLVYSTYLRGSDRACGQDVIVNPLGFADVAGPTSSDDFPVTVGAFQTVCGGVYGGFAAKFTHDAKVCFVRRAVSVVLQQATPQLQPVNAPDGVAIITKADNSCHS